jgi:hypothetical protein
MKPRLIILTSTSLLFTSALFLGCGQPEMPTSSNSKTEPAEPTGKQYLATAEPAGSSPVGVVRNSCKDGDKIALEGIIGGSTEPFIKGLAAFTIVDPKVSYCPPEEHCPTP